VYAVTPGGMYRPLAAACVQKRVVLCSIFATSPANVSAGWDWVRSQRHYERGKKTAEAEDEKPKE
jgi:hypothetical protein